MSLLFQPYKIGNVQLNNRIVIAPMCQYSAQNGQATDWHLIHLGNLALSGAGLLTIEATAVEPEGRISPNDLGLWSDETEAALKRILTAIRQYSSIPISIQLAHAGRKASCHVPWEGGRNIPLSEGGWETVAPSTNPYELSDSTPIELNNEMLPHILNAFVSTAKRAERLGVDIIELHSAHGYLLHQFLSPLSNSRTDEYGGSLENRMRFPLEVFKAMRKAVSATIPIGVRISATDWVEGGWDIEQSIEFCRALSKLDCAFIDVSSGGLSPKQKISLESGYQVPFAERIRQETGLPTIAVGLITEYEHAEEIIRKGQADMVALARGILYDPRWPWHAAAKLGSHVEAPNQYLRCQPRGLNTLFS